MLAIMWIKALNALLSKIGYVPEARVAEEQASLYIANRALNYCDGKITALEYKLREAEGEVDISRNLLSQCAEMRDQLREELILVTAERDIALGRADNAEQDLHEMEQRQKYAWRSLSPAA